MLRLALDEWWHYENKRFISSVYSGDIDRIDRAGIGR